ncbi:MAG: hypothetical protein AB7W47_17925 [Calditrichaceae bacterium]
MKFKKSLNEHILSLALVTLVMLAVMIIVRTADTRRERQNFDEIETYLKMNFVDFDDPFEKALLKETLNIFEPGNKTRNDSLLAQVDRYRRDQFLKNVSRAGKGTGLSGQKMVELIRMYFKFILAYLITLVLTYYAVQTLAVNRFIHTKQNRQSYLAELIRYIRHHPFLWQGKAVMRYLAGAANLLGKATVKGIGYFIAFSPAYVIAYSFRTEFNTDSLLFMILLGVISNGLLINYANRFYTFLVSESRKGYVETAVVKNLHSSYDTGRKDGISYRAVLSWKKWFPGHVFEHIFINARYQYLTTIKEQASFLITGLIIIEMALNIQGHLCYELLQNILYRHFDVVIVILLGLFYIVKLTELGADYLMHRESQKFENIAID